MHMIKRRAYHMGMIIVAYIGCALLVGLLLTTFAHAAEYLGRLGSNPYCADCSANPYSMLNNPYNPNSPRNHYGPYGNPYSPYSANNPYAIDTPEIYGTADE